MKLIIDISEVVKHKVYAYGLSLSPSDKEQLIKAIMNGIPLDNLKAEIEKEVWEDVVIPFDGTDEIRIPRLNPDDVFEIIDKYKAESEPQDKKDGET